MSKASAEGNYGKSKKGTKKGILGHPLDQRDFATMEKGHRVRNGHILGEYQHSKLRRCANL